MAFVPLPFGIKIRTNMLLDGQRVNNIYYVDASATGVDQAAVTLAALTFDNWMEFSFMGQVSQDMLYESTQAQDWTVADGFVATALPPVPIAGGQLQPSLPNNVSLVVKHLTGQAGRSFRGRTYVPGIDESEVVGNTASAGLTAALVSVFDTLRSDLAVNLFDLVVASFVSEGLPRVAGIATRIVAHEVNTRVDSQRRRLPGVGE